MNGVIVYFLRTFNTSRGGWGVSKIASHAAAPGTNPGKGKKCSPK